MNVYGYLADLQETIRGLPAETIEQVIMLLHEARCRGRNIFIMGNGGSASTASHFVCDLAKNTQSSHWPDFRVIGLTDNMALMTAYGNDEGYDNVFARQMAPFIQEEDIVIALSTSGRSRNVLRAVELANQQGARTIGLTGFDGGQLQALVEFNLHVPSDCIEHVEDAHLILEHLICFMLRELVQSHPNGENIQAGKIGATLATASI